MTYDINLLGNPTVPVALLRIDNSAITGAQKLLQRVVILLFTDSTVVSNLGLGTQMPGQDSSNIADLEVIRNLFNIALGQVKEQLLATTLVTAPDDEKISDLQVEVSESIIPGQVDVDVMVTTKSGSGASAKVPIREITAE